MNNQVGHFMKILAQKDKEIADLQYALHYERKTNERLREELSAREDATVSAQTQPIGQMAEEIAKTILAHTKRDPG